MNRLTVAVAVVFLLAAAGAGRAAAPPTDEKLLTLVAERMLVVCGPSPDPAWAWPPEITILDSDDLNAYAGLIERDKKPVPVIRICRGMMKKVVEGDEHRLAMLLGHELAHILKKHVRLDPNAKDSFKTVFDRQQELTADRLGAELMLKAGYSLQMGWNVIPRFDDLNPKQSSFAGFHKEHPSWMDRQKALDKEKKELWKEMPAFRYGVLYLAMEQYNPASMFFEYVTKEFPECEEAWALMGRAQLMQYFAYFFHADIYTYGIGQVVSDGFIPSNNRFRHHEIQHWNKAVHALKESNRLKKGQAQVLADLVMVHLFHPDGKILGLDKAMGYFTDALAAAKDDKALHPMVRAALLVNTGVALLAMGQIDKSWASIEAGEKILREFVGKEAKLPPMFESAIRFNKALMQAGKKEKAEQEKAVPMFEEYLATASQTYSWWKAAYAHYKALCKKLSKQPKKESDFKKVSAPFYHGGGITLEAGKTIQLGDELDAVEQLIGKKAVQLQVGSGFCRIRDPKWGLEILGLIDYVSILGLVGANAPALPLFDKEDGGKEVAKLALGITLKELDTLLGFDYWPTESSALGLELRYYRSLGIAVRIEKGRVSEIWIVSLPKVRREAP